jgi:predicted AAA+ superfamily ATPase
MFLERAIKKTLLQYAKFPVVGLFGPRHSGKTTLVKNIFNKHVYLNFEDPETRELALTDPKRLLQNNENKYGIIFDEFQYVPQILSYVQIESDEKKRPGYFVLTGSQNFLMNQAITQSLAGRIGILTLLPLSINELKQNDCLPSSVDELITRGGYPKMYTEHFEPSELYPSYIHSYVERDIRQLINVENLRTFQRFMQLCAGRIGQLLNISDIAMNCGIDTRTANSWISILEASYIIFLLSPYHENFSKRVTKTPKIYFYDTGLACSLLDLKSPETVALSPFRGHLFESLMIADFFKQYFSLGTRAPLYYWRDKNGLIEIDCLVNLGNKLIPLEVKSGQTILPTFFSSLSKWNEIAASDPANGYIVYGGDAAQQRSLGNIVGWREAGSLIETIESAKKSKTKRK